MRSTHTDVNRIILFLCGDVMTGRGVDQILEHACPPMLYESAASSALDYVALAERANGPIPRSAGHDYVWGVALEELERAKPRARIINLETSITTCDRPTPKGINYRMHPDNVAVLTAARIDCCVLANNHVLDWQEAGFLETLATLERAGIRVAGAGRSLAAAQSPAVLPLSDSRILVFGFGAGDSGIPGDWAANALRPGIHVLPDFSRRTADRIARNIRAEKRSTDIAIASIHWGGNWGYDVAAEHRSFAHVLIDDAGVDLVHGHSSHHPRAIEVHNGHLILYGCGDFIDDYEGIRGYEQFRDDLVLMFFPELDAHTGRLLQLRMTPLQIRNFRLDHPSEHDCVWLRERLDRECRRFGHGIAMKDGGFLLE